MRGLERIGRQAFAASAVAAVALTGCGGAQQDANEPSGNYTVEVLKASFPTSQRLAQTSDFTIKVRNAEQSKTVPNVAVTIENGEPNKPAQAFGEQTSQTGVADTSRPVWIIDEGPGSHPTVLDERNFNGSGVTAYTNTWALGPLAPGEVKTFTWRVTAVQDGVHTVKYLVAAGLNGKAKAQLSGGRPPEGSFTIEIKGKPAYARVGDHGQIIRSQ